MKTRDKYLVENKEEAARVLYNGLLSYIREYRKALETEMGFVNHTVLANELGNIIMSSINRALNKKEADFLKKVLKAGKPIMTYGKGSKK
jgi:hypothetical protein